MHRHPFLISLPTNVALLLEPAPHHAQTPCQDDGERHILKRPAAMKRPASSRGPASAISYPPMPKEAPSIGKKPAGFFPMRKRPAAAAEEVAPEESTFQFILICSTFPTCIFLPIWSCYMCDWTFGTHLHLHLHSCAHSGVAGVVEITWQGD